MTNTPTNNLSKQRILQLLAAVGSKPADDSIDVEAVEYDWKKPHRFNTRQLKKLDDFFESAATSMSRRFADLCPGNFNVTIDSTEQLFVDTLGQTSEQDQCDYYLAFSTEQTGTCGYIGVSSKTALVWTNNLLGEAEAEIDLERELSSLEESFLYDITCGIIEAFSEPHGTYDFRPTKQLTFKQMPLKLKAGELTRIHFKVQKEGTEGTDAQIMLLSDLLDPITGKTFHLDNEFSKDQIYKAAVDRIQQMPLSINVQLASTVLTLEQVMTLQVNDILLLNKKVDEPAEVIIDNQLVIHGQPVKSAGKYAVVITELTDRKT